MATFLQQKVDMGINTEGILAAAFTYQLGID